MTLVRDNSAQSVAKDMGFSGVQEMCEISGAGKRQLLNAFVRDRDFFDFIAKCCAKEKESASCVGRLREELLSEQEKLELDNITDFKAKKINEKCGILRRKIRRMEYYS
jgi:hypothetical protein